MLERRCNVFSECCGQIRRNRDTEAADDALTVSVPLGPETEIPTALLRRDAHKNLVAVWRGLEDRAWRLDHAKEVVKCDALLLEMKSIVLPPIVVKTERRRRQLRCLQKRRDS